MKPAGFLTRAFLAGLLMAGAGAFADAQAGPAEKSPARTGDRTLSFKIAQGVVDGRVTYADDAVHTVTYFRDGAYDRKALEEITRLLRDREGNAQPQQGIDKGLMDLLYGMKTHEEARHPGLNVVFHVISGYRSPETNEGLRTDPGNPFRASVGKDSMHTHAKAVDIFVPEIPGEELRDTAVCLQKGGVGWYPQFKDEFPHRYIHVDTGRVRYWGFTPQTLKCP